MENWKQVPDWIGIYEVSDAGRVRRVLSRSGAKICRLMKPMKNANGYEAVHLRYLGKESRPFVHYVVMSAFVGPRPYKNEINHIDGNRSNNSAENLEYCTVSENRLHSFRVLGRISPPRKGMENGRAILTDEKVREIRRRYSDGGVSQQAIADDIGISQIIVSRVIRKTLWSHVD